MGDYLSISLLARVYPSTLIGQVLDANQCSSVRQRSFPASGVLYYCMALSLYPAASYGDVFDAVTQGLAWRDRSEPPITVKSSSISDARSKLPWTMFKQSIARA